MLKEPIRFLEYQKRSKRELKEKYQVKNRDFIQLLKLNNDAKTNLMHVLHDHLKATSYVGIITVGRNTIQILPKISKDDNEQKIIENLLFMLAYTRKLKIKETEISKLCQRKENRFFEIIIYLFAKNLNETFKKNFHKNYNTFTDDLFFIRGKILFKNAQKNFVHKERVFCKYSEFTEEILINQIFKYTVFLLQRITADSENYRLLKNLELILSDVSMKVISPSDFQKIQLNRLNRYLDPLIELCKLFITKSAVELSHNKLETFSFVFKMEELFEEFIAEFIKVNKSKLFSVGTKVKPQDESKKLVDSPKKLFTLKPDILVKSDEKKLIIDTKYKKLNPEDSKKGVSQADMYQMLAYGIKHKCKQTVLLYPEHLLKTPPTDPHVIKTNKNQEVRVYVCTVPLDIDLRHQKNILLEKLRPICELINE